MAEETLDSLIVSGEEAQANGNMYALAANVYIEAEALRRTKRAEMKELIGVDNLADYRYGPRSAVAELIVKLHRRKEDMDKWNVFIIHELLELVPGNKNGYVEKIVQPGVAVLAS